jgi:hypothetical protein
VIAFALGELTIVPAEWVVEIALDFDFDVAVGVEERSGSDPRVGNDAVEPVPAQQEESVVTARSIDFAKLTVVDLPGDVDRRNH